MSSREVAENPSRWNSRPAASNRRSRVSMLESPGVTTIPPLEPVRGDHTPPPYDAANGRAGVDRPQMVTGGHARARYVLRCVVSDRHTGHVGIAQRQGLR